LHEDGFRGDVDCFWALCGYWFSSLWYVVSFFCRHFWSLARPSSSPFPSKHVIPGFLAYPYFVNSPLTLHILLILIHVLTLAANHWHHLQNGTYNPFPLNKRRNNGPDSSISESHDSPSTAPQTPGSRSAVEASATTVPRAPKSGRDSASGNTIDPFNPTPLSMPPSDASLSRSHNNNGNWLGVPRSGLRRDKAKQETGGRKMARD
jgi:hypothetical protein